MTKLGVLDVGGKKYSLILGEIYFVGINSKDYSHDIDIDDASVDIKHCFLDFTERSPKLFDLRSKCGTFVDGKRIPVNQLIPLGKSTAIQFGNVEAYIQLASEGDSGYLEGRITSPATSEMVCSSENVSSPGVRNSTAITNNSTAITNHSIKNDPLFIVPNGVPRRSTLSNTSAKSVDSFSIPETQYPVENINITRNSTNVSIDTNKSMDKTTTIADDDDFYIPETQEVIPHDRLSIYPRVAFQVDDVNETAPDHNKIPSSQFRICTQEFIGSDDNLSNNSDDLLADIPCSMVIPMIRHKPVQLDDILCDANDDEKDIEKEMSVLQWSKKTADDAEACPTPDNIFSVNGLAASDLIERVEGAPTVSQCSTPDIFAIPDHSGRVETEKVGTIDDVELKDVVEAVNESIKDIEKSTINPGPPADSLPTQLFVKPLLPPCDKENIGPQKDDWSLPATQVFMAPPAVKAKPVDRLSLPPLPPPPVSSAAPTALTVTADEEDLPPTQVFQKVVHVPPVIASKNVCLSSTLLDNGIQLSESSFRAKCNRFLDSDDDEMDEIVAPELVKQMRQSVDKLKEEDALPELTNENLPNNNPTQSAEKTSPIKEENIPTSHEEIKSSPIDEFRTPVVAVKTIPHRKEDIIIENYDFTPNFLLDKVSKNNITVDPCKTLFGSSCESDDSQDFLSGLLPNKKVPSDKVQSPPRQKEKTKTSQKQAETVGERVSRRRKSTFEVESSEKKQSRKLATDKTDSKRQSDKKIANESRESVAKNKENKIQATETKKPEVKGKAELHRSTTKLHGQTHKGKDKNEKEKHHIEEPSLLSSRRVTRQLSKESNSDHFLGSTHSSPNRPDTDGSKSEKKSSDKSEKKERKRAKSSVEANKKDAQKKIDKSSKSKQDTKSEEERLLPRVTRLRSAKDVATKENSVVELINHKSHAAESAPAKKTADNKEKRTKVNLTKSDKETTSKVSSKNEKKSKASNDPNTSSSKTSKRKNDSEVIRSKRVRSTSSSDSVVCIEPRRTKRPQKPKIAITMTDASYYAVLEQNSGPLWIYTKDPKECDVMIVEKGNRTFKIMVAIARGIPVVNLNWLKEVLKRKSTDIPYDSYIFEDTDFQSRHKFEMHKSLHLAQTTSLLDGISFMMTPGIRPTPNEMKDIIVCAGGIVLEHIPKPQDGQEIYLVSQPKDNQHWHRFRRANPNIKIVTSEGVMSSVMQQSVSPLKKSIIH